MSQMPVSTIKIKTQPFLDALVFQFEPRGIRRDRIGGERARKLKIVEKGLSCECLVLSHDSIAASLLGSPRVISKTEALPLATPAPRLIYRLFPYNEAALVLTKTP